jgi:hypothetical protein
MSARAHALALAAVLLLPATTRAEQELFPLATAGCYLGAEVTPAARDAQPYRKPAVPVTAVRLQRGHHQLVLEEQEPPRTDGQRKIYLRIIVTFADAGKTGAAKRFTNGLWHSMVCSADLCDAGNYQVVRAANGAVLLRMTGGLYVGAEYGAANRRLPDGRVYRLVARAMSACH